MFNFRRKRSSTKIFNNENFAIYSIIMTVYMYVVFLKFRHCEKVTLSMAHSEGWRAMDRMLFLWLVRTALVFPAARSHNLIVESWLPVTTCIVNRYMYIVAARVLYTLAGQTLSSLSNYHHSSNFMSHLWIGWLGDNISNSVGVSWQSVDTGLATHVPYLHNEYIITISLSLSLPLSLSLTLAEASLDPVTRTSMEGWSDIQ